MVVTSPIEDSNLTIIGPRLLVNLRLFIPYDSPLSIFSDEAITGCMACWEQWFGRILCTGEWGQWFSGYLSPQYLWPGSEPHLRI